MKEITPQEIDQLCAEQLKIENPKLRLSPGYLLIMDDDQRIQILGRMVLRLRDLVNFTG